MFIKATHVGLSRERKLRSYQQKKITKNLCAFYLEIGSTYYARKILINIT